MHRIKICFSLQAYSCAHSGRFSGKSSACRLCTQNKRIKSISKPTSNITNFRTCRLQSTNHGFQNLSLKNNRLSNPVTSLDNILLDINHIHCSLQRNPEIPTSNHNPICFLQYFIKILKSFLRLYFCNYLCVMSLHPCEHLSRFDNILWTLNS